MARVQPPAPTTPPTPAIQRGDRATFSNRVDAAITYLTNAPAEIGNIANVTYANALDAFASAGAALEYRDSALSASGAAAESALAAAESAAAAAQLTSTSATDNVLQTGPVTFLTQMGAGYKPGVPIMMVDQANPSRKMSGTVTSYTGSTLVASVTFVQGTGTVSDWNISVSGVQGPAGPIGGVAGGTVTGTLLLNGSASALGMVVTSAAEKVAVVSTPPATAFDYDVTVQNVMYFTAPAIGTWTPNIVGSSEASLNTLLGIGQSLSVVVLASQGATAFLPAGLQVQGASVTPKWQGGSAPLAGNANSIDAYTYTLIKTASNVFTVLASQSQFK